MANIMASKPSANGATLWMGDIDEDMNDSFIRTSFNLVNVNPVHVKLVRNKMTGQLIGYGFVTFESDEVAEQVLREVNGKPIPNSIQGKRFRLNYTSNRDEEFSIYVGDLGLQINDAQLFNAFSRRYPSVLSAKVMVSEGQSRRFGFVRFGSEMEYRRALAECDNTLMIGSQPITVRAAKPRRQRFNSYKNRTFMASPEVMVPQVVAEQPVCSENQEPSYGLEVNPYYGGVSLSGQPVLVYPMMPYGAFPVDSPYVYGQQPYGQQVYYPGCDNVYSIIPNPMYMDQMGHNQLMEAKQVDKLSDDMIARNQEMFSNIDSNRWPSQIDSDKEAKVQ